MYSEEENKETCKRLGIELENYCTDGYYKCPKCGELICWDNEEYDEYENEYTCPHCKEKFDSDELEAVSIYEYFSDNEIYNLEYRVDGNKEYRSVEVMIACGGPTIYIDTQKQAIILYWGSDEARYYLSQDTVNLVDEYFEELYKY